jgi:hypothetical protein
MAFIFGRSGAYGRGGGIRAILRREAEAVTAVQRAAERRGLQQQDAKQRGENAGARPRNRGLGLGSEFLKQGRISRGECATVRAARTRVNVRYLKAPRQSAARCIHGMESNSASQGAAEESLGARQSPRGDSEPPELTFGPFGMAVRLNWLVRKKRRRNTSSHFRISERS